MFRALLTRGYSRSFLRRTFKHFLDPPRDRQSPSLILPLVLDFSTSAVQLARTIWANFQGFTQEAGILANHRLVVAYKRRRNLKDLLVTAKIPLLTSPSVKKQLPQFISHRRWIRDKHTKKVFLTQSYSKPSLKNYIYLITCSVCQKRYVGETRNSLATRFYQYKYNILRKQNINIPVIKHFILHGWSAVETVVLENNPYWTMHQRRRREQAWIQTLDTIHPRGLNDRSPEE